MNQGRILVVDDEPQLRRMMRTILIAEGFEVTDVRNGGEALERLRTSKVDLILLDINMAGITGFETCRAIRVASDVPIIMLSVRKSEKDKTDAFEAGADDYVTKPFGTPELLARIRTKLARKNHIVASQLSHLWLGDVEIDFETRQIKGRKERDRLTPKEFELLSYLAIHANKIVTHRELLQQVWGSNFGDEREYLRVFINRLRKKIESEPDDPQYLLTEPWVGYRLRLSQ
jgi:two-component system, OmpR family, KDP operon response regulator KdpE